MAPDSSIDGSSAERPEVWVRLQLPSAAHHLLKQQAREEHRGLIDFLTSLLVDAAERQSTRGPESREFEDDLLLRSSGEPLDRMAKDAQEAIFVGTTLRSLSSFHDFIESKVARGAKFTFLYADRSVLSRGSALLHQVALRQARQEEEILRQVEQSVTWLNELESAHPEMVTVIPMSIVPGFGMLLVDPFKPSARLRVNLYLHDQDPNCDPLLDITPSTPESRVAFDLFVRHYVSLVTHATFRRAQGERATDSDESHRLPRDLKPRNEFAG